jgi:hypothetical protein
VAAGLLAVRFARPGQSIGLPCSSESMPIVRFYGVGGQSEFTISP